MVLGGKRRTPFYPIEPNFILSIHIVLSNGQSAQTEENIIVLVHGLRNSSRPWITFCAKPFTPEDSLQGCGEKNLSFYTSRDLLAFEGIDSKSTE